MNAVIKLRPFAFHIALPLAAGALSYWLAGDVRAVYTALRLPFYAPSAAVFGVVWIGLYLLMGTAAYLISVARIGREDHYASLTLYGLMLFMTMLWSVLFFRFRFFAFSAWWSVLILAMTFLCSALFYRIRHGAGILLMPVSLWIVYLAALNFTVAAMN